MDRSLIVVTLVGGLGNQLFQFAAGRALAHRRGVELAFDRSNFRWLDSRRRALNPFSIRATVRAGGHDRGARLNVVRERQFTFDAKILDQPDEVRLVGFFQSELYFREISGIIRQEATVATPMNATNRAVADQIRRSSAVSLHIRRGDYVTHLRTNEAFGTCSLDYYAQAADLISRATNEQPRFFVFSDDIEWAVTNLKLPFPTQFISHNRARHAAEDLRLMSLCRHHIIANSSFSWWGAWLNPSWDKIVIAPKKWMADGSLDESTLVPEEWFRI